MQLAFTEMDTPVGVLKLVAHDHALVAVMWDNEDHKRVRLASLVRQDDHPILLKTQQQLNLIYLSILKALNFRRKSGRRY
ncbi:Uncharacterised protein [Mycobacteroides abscessus subsp. abscessus]|nr:Uncharacterised protein [Mycobacteroides abscessus subsp. abscessus]